MKKSYILKEIAAERQRQGRMLKEGSISDGSAIEKTLAAAEFCLAVSGLDVPGVWPFGDSTRERTRKDSIRRRMVKAAALLVWAIEDMDASGEEGAIDEAE